MTIEKAIRLLQELDKGCDPVELQISKEALNLGIEALKHIRDTREKRLWANVNSLPGETKEGGG